MSKVRKNNIKDLKDIEENIGEWCPKQDFLIQALTHTSYVNENRHLNLESNQRLEFLGDAVIEIIISDHLYKNYPTYSEGVLTKIRAAVVCEPSLAKVAQDLNLGSYLLMGKGESKSGGRKRPSILADAFESLVGAIYLDQGFEKARQFVLAHLRSYLEIFSEGNNIGDYKSDLQELVQQKSDKVTSYVILKEEGPDHNKIFVAGVTIDDSLWGKGLGRTKKMAEQAAAEDALKRLEKGVISFG